MPGNRKFPLFLFGLLTVINAAIFLRRQNFDYKPYVEEAVLYKPPSGEWNSFFTDFPAEGRAQANQFLDSVLKDTDTAAQVQVKRIGTFL